MTGWILLGLVLKVTLVLAAGLGIARALRHRAAAIRHGTLVATAAAAVALPALTVVLPGWNVPLFDAGGGARPSGDAVTRGVRIPVGDLSSPVVSAAEGHPGAGAAGAHSDPAPAWIAGAASLGRDAAPVITLPPGGEAGAPWLRALVAVWAVGALAVLGRFGLDVARARALLGEAVEAPDGIHSRMGIRIAERLGVRRPARILFSERLTVPVTWGVLEPVVILPLEAWEWRPERIRIALLHELAHVRRRDCLSSVVSVAASALWWFHPLQWACRRRLRVDQERACDDVVLLDGVGPTAYASMLVDFARGLSPLEEATTARAAIAMARRSTLRDRIETILGSGRRSLRLEPRTAGIVAVVAATLLVPLAAVHLWGETAEARRAAELIGELASPDPATRVAAAWGLGALDAEAAIEPLLGRLSDPDPRVRGVAARSLGRVGGARAFAPLVGLLDDPDPFVRELAILGLEQVPSADRVAALVPVLDDPEMGVRAVVVSALGDVEGEEAARALAEVAKNDPDAHTRGMAIGSLAKRAERDLTVPALVGLLGDADVDIREKAARGLAEIGEERAVSGLVDRLANEGVPRVRDGIVRALAGFAGDPRAVDGLLAAIRDPEWGVRLSAAAGLAGSDEPRAAAALVEALRDPVHQVRLESAWSLDAIESRR
jgi:HEAT repeat protein